MPHATPPARSAPRAAEDDWRESVAPYQEPDHKRAVWQVITSHGAYALVWCAMFFAWQLAWWLALPLAVLAGGLLVRVFIIFHDCGHGSFLRSRRANSILGFVSGLLTYTPYHAWRGEHARHHKSSGDLGRRGIGDLWTMTVEEYLAASRWRRFSYRLARNPWVLFLIAPLFTFVIYQRIPTAGAEPRHTRSVWVMNLALVLWTLLGCWVFGALPYLVLQAVVMAVAGSAGVWLFYVQHQFEDTYWTQGAEWNYTTAALRGSSYYRLPRILQWFSGNIGFHHVHHLSPSIPNYHLEACHRSDPLFSSVPPLTLRASLRSASLRLWDESSSRLICFRQLRALRPARVRARAPAGARPRRAPPGRA